MADHMVKLSEVPKGQRWQYFMDYYKYRVIIAVCLLIAAVPVVYYNFFEQKPDMSILATYQLEVPETLWQEASEKISPMISDYNEDGETVFLVEGIYADDSYAQKDGQMQMAYQTKLMAYLQDARHVLQIVDEEMYTYMEVQGCLARYGELENTLGHDKEEFIKIPLKDLKPFDEMDSLPDGLYMTLRPKAAIERGIYKNDPVFYERQLDLFYAMLK